LWDSLSAVTPQEAISMKAYVITTGAVFALLTLAHLVRIIVEWPHLTKNPFFLLITVATGGLCLWAWRVLRLSTRRDT
jgi:hypothetical protein